MVAEVTRTQVVAFRLAAHGLGERAAGDELLDVAGRCAVQDTPPGSALLALHARVRGVTREEVGCALAETRTLLRTWSLRGAPFVVPTADASVFTTGVLPPTEKATRNFLPGLDAAVSQLGIGAIEAVDLTEAQIGPALAGRQLAIEELGAGLAQRIAPELSGETRLLWEGEGPYRPSQPFGEAVVHFCLRILALRGVVCFAARVGRTAPFVLVSEWLGDRAAALDPAIDPVLDPALDPAAGAAAARAELVRRYLRCYGPSDRRRFAAWVGISPGDASAWWCLIEDELTPVEFDGRSWLLTEDVEALHSAQLPRGVRLLPPHDPYTQLRDRATIVGREFQRDVWRRVGDPGTVLADGEVVGTWRPRTSNRRLTFRVTTFRPLSDAIRESVRGEAAGLAALRGATSVDVEFGDWK